MFNMNLGIVGLQTVTIAVPVAGTYLLSGKLALPTISEGATDNSQVVTTIKQNGSTIYTGQAGAKGFGCEVICAANDSMQVILTSSNAVDQGLNVVQGVISIG